MSLFSGIIGSQSRYELQQALLINPKGLVTNTTNRFGIVDGSSNVSELKSINNIKNGSFAQGVVASQPSLSLGMIDFKGEEYMELNAPSNIPLFFDWDDPFFISMQINTSNTENNKVIYSICYTGGGQSRIAVQISNGSIVFLFADGAGNNKIISTNDAFNDGFNHEIIWYNPGTDDASDWVIWIDDSLYTNTTIDQDGSYVGYSFKTLGGGQFIGLARRNDISGPNFIYIGKIGKIIVGLGEPNYEVLTKALNATTF